MENVLLSPVEYKTEATGLGTWRRFLGPTGLSYADFTSHLRILGLPVFHFAVGVSPETGRRAVAKGIVAVGPRAFGVLAVGRFASGIVAIGQGSFGVLALGQAAAGLLGVGQLALGAFFAAGQLAAGRVCVAQLGIGERVLAQLGFGEHVWSMVRKDPEAVAYFTGLWRSLVG